MSTFRAVAAVGAVAVSLTALSVVPAQAAGGGIKISFGAESRAAAAGVNGRFRSAQILPGTVTFYDSDRTPIGYLNFRLDKEGATALNTTSPTEHVTVSNVQSVGATYPVPISIVGVCGTGCSGGTAAFVLTAGGTAGFTLHYSSLSPTCRSAPTPRSRRGRC